MPTSLLAVCSRARSLQGLVQPWRRHDQRRSRRSRQCILRNGVPPPGSHNRTREPPAERRAEPARKGCGNGSGSLTRKRTIPHIHRMQSACLREHVTAGRAGGPPRDGRSGMGDAGGPAGAAGKGEGGDEGIEGGWGRERPVPPPLR